MTHARQKVALGSGGFLGLFFGRQSAFFRLAQIRGALLDLAFQGGGKSAEFFLGSVAPGDILEKRMAPQRKSNSTTTPAVEKPASNVRLMAASPVDMRLVATSELMPPMMSPSL